MDICVTTDPHANYYPRVSTDLNIIVGILRVCSMLVHVLLDQINYSTFRWFISAFTQKKTFLQFGDQYNSKITPQVFKRHNDSDSTDTRHSM